MAARGAVVEEEGGRGVSHLGSAAVEGSGQAYTFNRPNQLVWQQWRGGQLHRLGCAVVGGGGGEEVGGAVGWGKRGGRRRKREVGCYLSH